MRSTVLEGCGLDNGLRMHRLRGIVDEDHFSDSVGEEVDCKLIDWFICGWLASQFISPSPLRKIFKY
jgi:hypothetical protein